MKRAGLGLACFAGAAAITTGLLYERPPAICEVVAPPRAPVPHVIVEAPPPPPLDPGPCLARIDRDPAHWWTGGDQFGPFRKCSDRIAIPALADVLPGFEITPSRPASVGDKILHVEHGDATLVTVFNLGAPSLVIHDPIVVTWGGIRVGEPMRRVHALDARIACDGLDEEDDSIACSYAGDENIEAKHWMYILDASHLTRRARNRLRTRGTLPAAKVAALPIAAIGWDP
ncbi:MAG TPA: hypothetical protein VFQ53_28305 [Kofleriaceae bacterium]|nr:hypothetical protein [Kofleriaceae bacterium]